MKNDLKKLASEFGRMGGKSGKGESKRRDPEHYIRIAKLSHESRRKKREEAEAAKSSK